MYDNVCEDVLDDSVSVEAHRKILLFACIRRKVPRLSQIVG